MKTIYLVFDDCDDPVLACESRVDAVDFVTTTYHERTQTKIDKHIKKLSYIEDPQKELTKKFDSKDLKDVINMTIYTTLEARKHNESYNSTSFSGNLTSNCRNDSRKEDLDV